MHSNKKVTRKPKQKRPARTARPVQTLSLNDMLQTLDRFMLKGRETDRRGFYDIITALRGPDAEVGEFGDYAPKAAITQPLRYAVFKTGYPGFRGSISADTEEFAAKRREIGAVGGIYHYVSHAIAAFDAMGMKWNEVNDLDRGRKGYILK